MEDDLDRIAAGDEERTAWLRRFYFGDEGDDEGPEGARLRPRRHRRPRGQHDRDRRRDRAARRPLRALHRAERRAGHDLRRDRARRADGRARPRSSSRRPPTSASSASNPETGRTVLVKNGRYGPYVTEEAEDGEKPKTASLFKSMSPETRDARGGRCRCSRCRASVGSDPATARRSSSRTAATGRS